MLTMDTSEKRKVLVVDTNEIIRLFFKDVFWLHGLDARFELELAENIESAWKVLRDPMRKPDILFLDLLMYEEKEGRRVTSHMIGLEFLEEIRKQPTLNELKVVIFCDEKSPELVKEAKRLGAVMFLQKQEHLPQDIINVMDKL